MVSTAGRGAGSRLHLRRPAAGNAAGPARATRPSRPPAPAPATPAAAAAPPARHHRSAGGGGVHAGQSPSRQRASQVGDGVAAAPRRGRQAAFRRFDVQQWLRERERRLLRSGMAAQQGQPPAQPSQHSRARGAAAPGTDRGGSGGSDCRDPCAPQVDKLARSLDAIGEKLQAMSERIGVGDGIETAGSGEGATSCRRGGSRPGHGGSSSALRAREELIVALHEVVKTQSHCLVTKEQELKEYYERLRGAQDEEETIFALVDTIEQSEAELARGELARSELQGRCEQAEGAAAGLRQEVASLQWQLRVAVPDAAMRQLIADQAEQADLVGRAELLRRHADGASAGAQPRPQEVAQKIAETDAEHRRLFLIAARELDRMRRQEGPESRARDAAGSWGQRVDAIWGEGSSSRLVITCLPSVGSRRHISCGSRLMWAVPLLQEACAR
jgi:hypothetical protein